MRKAQDHPAAAVMLAVTIILEMYHEISPYRLLGSQEVQGIQVPRV